MIVIITPNTAIILVLDLDEFDKWNNDLTIQYNFTINLYFPIRLVL